MTHLSVIIFEIIFDSNKARQKMFTVLFYNVVPNTHRKRTR